MVPNWVFDSKVLKRNELFVFLLQLGFKCFGVNDCKIKRVLFGERKASLSDGHKVKVVNIVALLVNLLPFAKTHRSQTTSNPGQVWFVAKLSEEWECAEGFLVYLSGNWHLNVQREWFNKVIKAVQLGLGIIVECNSNFIAQDWG